MTNWKRLLVFYFIVISVYAILFALEYCVLSGKTISFFNLKMDRGKFYFNLQILYMIASMNGVWASEVAGIFFFGKAIANSHHGLIPIPLGFYSIRKETGRAMKDELPADPNHIFRVKLGEPEVVPPELAEQGYVPPIRMTFAFSDDEENSDPLSSRITAEIVMIIRWRITDYVQFFTVIGSIKEARRQLNAVSVNILFPILSEITVSKALKTLPGINRKLEIALDDMMEGKGDKDRPWGTRLEMAAIKEIKQSHDLNDKIEEVAKAKISKEVKRLEGEGDGAKEEATIAGRGAGILSMSAMLNIPTKAVLGAEVSRAITSNPGQKTFIAGSGGFKDIISAASVVGEALTSSDDKTEEKQDEL